MALAAQNAKDSKYIHDTVKLMRNYRDALWNVEVSERNLQAEFRAEYGACQWSPNYRFRYFQSTS